MDQKFHAGDWNTAHQHVFGRHARADYWALKVAQAFEAAGGDVISILKESDGHYIVFGRVPHNDYIEAVDRHLKECGFEEHGQYRAGR